MFKFFGHSQFLEICATSKEVVLFHDNGFVLLRLDCRFNYTHPFTALVEKIHVYPRWMLISNALLRIFIGFSLFVLLVMNVDRYLATHYPIFHRTSVTKGKLLTLFTVLHGYHSNNFVRDACKRLGHLFSSSPSHIFHYFHSFHVFYQLQIVYSRQKKSPKQHNIT